VKKNEELALFIREQYETFIANKIKVSPSHSNRASSLGHPCAFYGFLNRAKWAEAKAPDTGLQKIFERGNMIEPVLRNLLRELGVHITAEQRPARWEFFQITGHFDGIIADSDRWGRIGVELKTTGNPVLANAKSGEEMRIIRPLGEKWFGQTQAYMIVGNFEMWLTVVLDVMGWNLNPIPIDLDLGYAETLLKRAEAINLAFKYWEENDIIPENAGEAHALGVPMLSDYKICRRCQHYGTSCFPSVTLGEGATVLADDELESDLNRRAELEVAAKEFKALDERIKSRVKFSGAEVIVGDHIIYNTTRTRASFDIPKEVKEQYRAEPTEYIETKFGSLKAEKEKEEAET